MPTDPERGHVLRPANIFDPTRVDQHRYRDFDYPHWNASLALAKLTLLQGQLELTQSLLHIATLAMYAIPGADGASVTIFESAGPDTTVSCIDFVDELEQRQSALGEGPRFTAVALGQTVRSGNFSAGEWPQLQAQVDELSIDSVLAIPLVDGRQMLGALSAYARRRDAFSTDAQLLAEQFAHLAAISADNAQSIARTTRTHSRHPNFEALSEIYPGRQVP